MSWVFRREGKSKRKAKKKIQVEKERVVGRPHAGPDDLHTHTHKPTQPTTLSPPPFIPLSATLLSHKIPARSHHTGPRVSRMFCIFFLFLLSHTITIWFCIRRHPASSGSFPPWKKKTPLQGGRGRTLGLSRPPGRRAHAMMCVCVCACPTQYLIFRGERASFPASFPAPRL